jgi:iron-sulfur cluster repair protein YtfE (RIC family)
MTQRTPGLGVVPTPPPDGDPAAIGMPWDESTRPRGPAPDMNTLYTEGGRDEARSLVEVHGRFRAELVRLRDLVVRSTEDVAEVGSARSALNALALRQNNWTVSGRCQIYCALLTSHHVGEDQVHFPRILTGDPRLAPVLDRLNYEHEVIAETIDEVDRALVVMVAAQREGRDDATGVLRGVDQLMTMLLSHFAYEEHELVEPIARLALG